jgi:hypothetical protein
MDKNKNIVDDNYFKDLESLIGEKSNNPFKVPKDYFTDLPERINNKCFKTKDTTLFQKFISLILRPSVSISLGIIIIAIVAFAYIFNKPNENKNININSVSENKPEKATEDYLIENENIDDTFLIEAATDDSTENESIFLTTDAMAYISNDISNNNDFNNPVSDTIISKEEIINYLVEENIDPNDFN